MSVPCIFKVDVEFENEGHKPLRIAITKNSNIRTIQDAVNHLLAPIGEADGKKITRIHHRDPETGEFHNISKATPVRNEPYPLDEAPQIAAIADSPPPVK